MGAHSKSSTIRRATALAATLAMPAVGAFALASPAYAGDVLDEIEQCESGGDPTAQNPSSSASGAFQFIDDTWQSVTGLSGSAKDYPYHVQRDAAEELYNEQGGTPWAASAHCWGGGGGAIEDRSGGPAPAPAPEPAPAPAPSGPVVDSGRASDGTGEYTCTADKLSFDACDPHNIGEVVAYPLYDGHGSAQRPSSAGGYTVRAGDTLSNIAEAHGTTVQRLVEINDIANSDLIFAGNSLHVG